MSGERLDQSLLAELHELDELRVRYQLNHPRPSLGQKTPMCGE